MITQEEAIKIAEKHHGPKFEFCSITHGVPDNCSLYGSFSHYPDDVWCVVCSAHHPEGMLASSRAIVICKNTGKVLYDGSANDEG